MLFQWSHSHMQRFSSRIPDKNRAIKRGLERKNRAIKKSRYVCQGTYLWLHCHCYCNPKIFQATSITIQGLSTRYSYKSCGSNYSMFLYVASLKLAALRSYASRSAYGSMVVLSVFKFACISYETMSRLSLHRNS